MWYSLRILAKEIIPLFLIIFFFLMMAKYLRTIQSSFFQYFKDILANCRFIRRVVMPAVTDQWGSEGRFDPAPIRGIQLNYLFYKKALISLIRA